MGHGKGKALEKNGDRYEGDFINDKYHGTGKLIKKENGWVYVGEFKEGKLHGKATVTKPNGDSFTGEHVNGVTEGLCVYRWKDGSRLEAEYKDGEANGRGKKYDANGRLEREGVLKHG